MTLLLDCITFGRQR